MAARHYVLSAILFAILVLGQSAVRADDLKVTPPPEDLQKRLKLDPFYKKCIVTGGLTIVASDKVSDMAILEAAYIVDHMLAGRDDVRKAIVDKRIRLDRKSTRLNSSHIPLSRMPSSA